MRRRIVVLVVAVLIAVAMAVAAPSAFAKQSADKCLDNFFPDKQKQVERCLKKVGSEGGPF